MIFLIVLNAILFLWISYIRSIYFSRKPKVPKEYNHISSPAEGTIVYIRPAENFITKRNDEYLLKTPVFDASKKYTQVGIFMSPYDNHHVVHNFNSNLLCIQSIGNVNPISMSGYLDSLLLLVGKKFYNWYERSKEFLTKNQVYILTYENGIIVCVTLDKYVNKVNWYRLKRSVITVPMRTPAILKKPEEIGFIYRGSQTDIFIPEGYTIQVKEGDKVSYDTVIAI